MGIPHGDKHYNVPFVFCVDPHQYRSDQLARFDEAADQRLDEITSFDAVEAVDESLEEVDAFTAEEIERRIEQLDGGLFGDSSSLGFCYLRFLEGARIQAMLRLSFCKEHTDSPALLKGSRWSQNRQPLNSTR